jgi:hypothetical protein
VHEPAKDWTRERLSLLMKVYIMHNILTKDKDKEASIDIGVGDGAYAKII